MGRQLAQINGQYFLVSSIIKHIFIIFYVKLYTHTHTYIYIYYIYIHIYTYICIYIYISSEIGKLKPNFSAIYKDLNTDTSASHNASSSSIRSTCASTDLSLDTQDEEILNILEELQGSANQRVECTEQCRLTGNFVSDTVFSLSNKILSDTKIRVLEKGLNFAPIQNKLNEPELMRDFKEFCRRMRLK